jgi:amino acid transporter
MTLILLLSITALIRHTPEGISATPFSPTAIFGSGAGISLMFAFGMFVGFESTVVYGEEVRRPRRTIPLATYISIALIGVIFSLSSYAITMGWGVHGVVTEMTSILTHGGDPSTLTTGLAKSVLGAWSVDLVQILFMTSVFAFLVAFHNISVRYMFSLGRSGLLPRPVGRTHHEHKSPHIASAIQTLIAALALLGTAALGWDPYLQVSAWLAAVALLGFLVLYAVTSLAVICFFHRTRSESGLWATKLAPAISGIAIVWAIVLTVTNFDQYVGAGHALASGILMLSIPVIAVAGLGVAFWLRTKRPAVFSSAGVSIEITPEAAEIIDGADPDADLKYQAASSVTRERHDDEIRKGE